LLPVAAHASFNSPIHCADFRCHFAMLGILAGIVGVPVFGVLFGLLHLVFCHRQRSRLNQFFIGAFVGMAVFEIAAAAAAGVAAGTNTQLGARGPSIAFTVAFLLPALLSVLYARSAPRHDP
jgi:uncharacterized membrane protein YadS